MALIERAARRRPLLSEEPSDIFESAGFSLDVYAYARRGLRSIFSDVMIVFPSLAHQATPFAIFACVCECAGSVGLCALALGPERAFQRRRPVTNYVILVTFCFNVLLSILLSLALFACQRTY
jgi:hypothetical protein